MTGTNTHGVEVTQNVEIKILESNQCMSRLVKMKTVVICQVNYLQSDYKSPAPIRKQRLGTYGDKVSHDCRYVGSACVTAPMCSASRYLNKNLQMCANYYRPKDATLCHLSEINSFLLLYLPSCNLARGCMGGNIHNKTSESGIINGSPLQGLAQVRLGRRPDRTDSITVKMIIRRRVNVGGPRITRESIGTRRGLTDRPDGRRTMSILHMMINVCSSGGLKPILMTKQTEDAVDDHGRSRPGWCRVMCGCFACCCVSSELLPGLAVSARRSLAASYAVLHPGKPP